MRPNRLVQKKLKSSRYCAFWDNALIFIEILFLVKNKIKRRRYCAKICNSLILKDFLNVVSNAILIKKSRFFIDRAF